MQQLIYYIRQELGDIYTHSELSSLIRIILKEVFKIDYIGISTDKNNNLSLSELSKIEDIVRRLKKSEPIQYVLGKTEFYGFNFKVTPDVLIPRPETEELVEWILTENIVKKPVILDVGTGSGCIAITLAKKLSEAEVHAWDISDKALNIATENARINNVSVHFKIHDVLSVNTVQQFISEDKKYDIIVSNPPYVMESEKKDMDVNVLHFEPYQALFVTDENPLLFYDRISEMAQYMLKNNGKLYFEINRKLSYELTKLLESKGFEEVELRKDISRNFRMIRGTKKI